MTLPNMQALSQLKAKGKDKMREKLPRFSPAFAFEGEKQGLGLILVRVSHISRKLLDFQPTAQRFQVLSGPETQLCLFLPDYHTVNGRLWFLD